MKVLGIIAEFNPFHNGHKYLIEEAKKKTGADACIIVMSGDFVQRGEAALVDKFTRAKIATSCGADIVVELPAFIATASAEGFAYGAVSLLNSLNVVDYLAFGTENCELDVLNNIARLLVNENDRINEMIKKQCLKGISYPLARSNAISSLLGESMHDFISQPNNILAIEYLKSLHNLDSDIKPLPIMRLGSGYKEIEFNNFSSATGIRHFIKNNENYSECLPKEAFRTMKEYDNNRGYIFEEDIFSLLLYKLLTLDNEKLNQYADSNNFIANRIKNAIYQTSSYNELLSALSSKTYPLSRIKRVLIHILLDIDKSIIKNNNYSDYTAHYARLLSCTNEKLLSYLCKNSAIPVITKLSLAKENLTDEECRHLLIDINAGNIYQSMISYKYNKVPLNQYSQNIFPNKTKEH